MHMTIHKSRHQHTTVKIDYLCVLADVALYTFVVADINDPAVADGQRFLNAVIFVDRVYIAVSVDRVCRRVNSADGFAQGEGQKRQDGKENVTQLSIHM